MRFTSFYAVMLCFLLPLAGCSSGSRADIPPEHTVNISFNGSSNCQAFFVQNDVPAYAFTNEGTYVIAPGEYVFLYSCGRNAFGTFMKTSYPPGKMTFITGNPGIRFQQ